MAEQTATEATQRDAAAESQRDTHEQPTQREGAQTQAQAQAQAQAERDTVAYSTYQKALGEVKSLKERLRQYDEDAKAKMTEAERLQKEREDFDKERKAFQQERRASMVEGIARTMGAVYPDTIINLISEDLDNEKDIKKALAQLQADRPRLFQTGSADGGTRGDGVAPDFNEIIRQRLAGKR